MPASFFEMQPQQPSDDRPWSVSEITFLRKQAVAGDSIEETAKGLMRSEEAVLAKAMELGIILPQNSK